MISSFPKDKLKEKKRSRSKDEIKKKLNKKKKNSNHDVSIDSQDPLDASIHPITSSPTLKENVLFYIDPLAEQKKKIKSTDHRSNSISQADAYREKHGITLDLNPVGTCDDSYSLPIFDPIVDFQDLDIDPSLLDCLKSFSKPTPIQSQCWPIALSKRDLIGIAETGSGKTLAFSLPLLNLILPMHRNNDPICLVISPTRELASQISKVFTDIGNPCNIKTACIFGGAPRSTQCQMIRKGVDIIVATPGRLLDLLQDQSLSVSSVRFLVLDEADRMLDMGFEPDICAIVSYLIHPRQTFMFSATWPLSIQNIAKKYLSKPIKVVIGSSELTANERITQIVEVMEPRTKDSRLSQLLECYQSSKNDKIPKIIVFVLYKKEATRVEINLRNKGYSVQGIHSDKNQTQRTMALDSFRSGKCSILVATDVAARGLDIEQVEYVINYSFPLTIEDYIHRIGRTGRAGKDGIAHTFFTSLDKHHSGELIQVLQQASQDVPKDLLKFGTCVKPKTPKLGTIDINASFPVTIDSKNKETLNEIDSGHLIFD